MNDSREHSSMAAGGIRPDADGKMDDVSEELKAFLDYVAGKKPEDTYVHELDEAVKEAKKNREWRHEYMTLLMRDEENQEIGEEKMLLLVEKLIKDKRFDDISRMKADKEYRPKLYKEYQID